MVVVDKKSDRVVLLSQEEKEVLCFSWSYKRVLLGRCSRTFEVALFFSVSY